ncbi:MAG: flagellar hook assembly protein FlgD [Burkholderiales bacterium]|nr:flagellar hook assembly protein FlgD [Burkholderiales bacterium]
MTTVSQTSTENLLASLGVSSSSTKSASESQQDRFLTLLVTQMRNQDPLNPMENAEVTTQIAQISTVNGIDKLNATLQAMETSFLAAQTLQAGTLIGRGVLSEGDAMVLEQGSASAAFVLDARATEVQIEIRRADGTVVHTDTLNEAPAGTSIISWDGKDDGGNQLPDGVYAFEVSAIQDGKRAQADTLGFGRVHGVVLDAGGLMLDTHGLGVVPLGQVRQILQ